MHEAAAEERKRLVEEAVPLEQFEEELVELDALSNRVRDLIRAGGLEEAERVSRDLLRRFPDQLDGIEGLARVYEARGESAAAAEHYRRAALFAERGEGYDPDLIADLRRRARELDARAKGGDVSGTPEEGE
jgi:hypothetical protein